MTAGELIADLQRPWRHGEHLDARGAVFEDPVVLDGLTLRGFDLTGAEFRGGLQARGATFLGLAWLREARIDGPLDLAGARFRIDFRAEGLAADAVLLCGAQVQGVLALARLRARTVDLTGALVMANLTLENARLSQGLALTEAEIMGGLWAEGAGLGRVEATGCDVSGRLRGVLA